MDSGIQIDATFFGRFGVKVRSLIKPESPLALTNSSITLGVPIVGAVTIFWTN
jgi:hypothetical protein